MANWYGNTDIMVDNMSKRYLTNIFQKTVIYPMVNRELEAELLTQWDTTKVKYFNPITLNTVTDSGEVITVDDSTEQSADLVVDQVRNKGFREKDIETVRNSLNKQTKLVELTTDASAQVLDIYAATTAIAGAGTVTDGTGTPVTKETIFANIESMRVTLDEQGLFSDGTQRLFLKPQLASFLRQSGIYDSEGLNKREKAAYVTGLSGFQIFSTNNIPTADAGANSYMFAMDYNSVHGAEQMNKFKVEHDTGWMNKAILFENVFGMDVLGLNSTRIVAYKYAI